MFDERVEVTVGFFRSGGERVTEDVLLGDGNNLRTCHGSEPPGFAEHALDSVVTAMHGGFEPHEVVGGVVEDIGDDVMTLPFDAVLIARTVEGSTDDQMAKETSKLTHRRIGVSSFPVMSKSSFRTICLRESMFYLGYLTATIEMKPLPIRRDIKVGDRLIVMIVDGLIESEPSTLLGVGMDDVGREKIPRVIHDDDFGAFIGHSNQGFGCRRGRQR